MAPFTGDPSQAQMVAMAITPKITGLLSLLGSGYIVRDCLRQLKSGGERGRGGTVTTSSSAHIYQRLMIGMSISDMIMSFGFVLSTLPAPRGTPNVWGAIGNTRSCTFAGMFTMMGVVPTMYNGSLSIYYLLRIRNGWTLTQLQGIEKWLHGIPWIWGISVVIASLFLKLFNSGLFECWLAPYPQGCTPSYKSTPENPPTCTRGDNIALYQWGFDMIPKLSSILIVTINMYLTWYSLYQQEQQTKRFSMGTVASRTDDEQDGTDGASNKRRRPSASRRPSQIIKLSVAQRLARQSYFYVGALYLTYIPVVTARLNEAFTGYVHWEQLYVISLLVPMQGFWNAFVYLRPRYLKYRKDEMKKLGQTPVSTESHNSKWFSINRVSQVEGAPSMGHRNMLQTLGDAFRDGAIDDEAELDELEARKSRAAQAAASAAVEVAERTEPSKVSFGATDEQKPVTRSSTVNEDDSSEKSLNDISDPDGASEISAGEQRADGEASGAGGDQLLSSLVDESKPFDSSMHFF